MYRTLCLFFLLACWCGHAHAEKHIDMNKLIGIQTVNGEVLAAMSCRDLYLTATRLEPETQNYRSALLNENTDILVSAIGTMFKPALYAYSLTIPWHFKEDYRMQHTNQSLDAVRQRMSALHCFQR